MLKKNCQLFWQLCIACQVRDGNLDEFFSHENQTFPTSLSKDDMIINQMFYSLWTTYKTRKTLCRMHCYWWTSCCQYLGTCELHNLQRFSKKVFLPFILQQFQSDCSRVDIVWDVYLENSLKEFATIKRGQGVCCRVLQDSKIPSTWHAFLRVDRNKIELFKFLAVEASQLQTDRLVITTICVNYALINVKFPTTLKNANVTLVHKKHDPTDKTNFRPNSVLP